MLDGRIVTDTATRAEHGRTAPAGEDLSEEPAVTDETEADGDGQKERS